MPKTHYTNRGENSQLQILHLNWNMKDVPTETRRTRAVRSNLQKPCLWNGSTRTQHRSVSYAWRHAEGSISIFEHPNNTNALRLKHMKKKLPINLLSYVAQRGTAKPEPSRSKGYVAISTSLPKFIFRWYTMQGLGLRACEIQDAQDTGRLGCCSCGTRGII
jgi:hypothetical protein